jgi:hypothetical protein
MRNPSHHQSYGRPIARLLVRGLYRKTHNGHNLSAHCGEILLGKYHKTAWNETICNGCYQQGSYAAAIDNDTAWFTDDFGTIPVKP